MHEDLLQFDTDLEMGFQVNLDLIWHNNLTFNLKNSILIFTLTRELQYYIIVILYDILILTLLSFYTIF